ncbi:MAG: hypothetical protein Hyperionvirus9_20 [Hyperionvirus sp.]|uniref:Uncharacterized protein n=1 Tax=Hyperionvirus sp. TaxID=2487770 RepID=A0A3G5ACJ7_9VIRU|nr:MAG: hypothetical protein Hyperionvirus9_20 [Hyperionvirus sp.]
MDHNQAQSQEIEDDVQQDMTSTEPPAPQLPKPEVTAATVLKTPFGDIEYKPDLKLSRASIMQLITCYTYRLNTQQIQTNNKWQDHAYPRLQKMFTGLCETFTQAITELYNSPLYDKEVVLINFCGYKNFKLPLIVQTPGVHHRATYMSVNVRPFLKTIEQRLMYLSTVKVPARYKDDEKKVGTFKKVQSVAEELRTKFVIPLHESWKKLCQDAADIAGIVVENREPKTLVNRRSRGPTKNTRRQPLRGK